MIYKESIKEISGIPLKFIGTHKLLVLLAFVKNNHKNLFNENINFLNYYSL